MGVAIEQLEKGVAELLEKGEPATKDAPATK